MADGAATKTTLVGETTEVLLKWPDVELTISINPKWNRIVQLSGIRGWLDRFPKNERESISVQSFLADLDRTTICYGSTISPGYDTGGKVVRLFTKLIAPVGGFFFTHQSFYGSTGQRIAGLPGDPARMGPK